MYPSSNSRPFNRRPKFNRSSRPGGFGGGGGGRGRRGPVSQFRMSWLEQPTVQVEAVIEPEIQHSFADFGLHTQLQNNLSHLGYTTPTPIQDQTIAALLEGHDVTGLANTGTGKTAAFLVPIINKLLADNSQSALVVAPTRELAVQIDQEWRGLTARTQLRSAICIGGMSLRPQMAQLSRRPQLVIGTPGRLKDLYQQRYLNLNEFQTLVLDEVDQMLDMGFRRDIEFITKLMPADRQTVFFSATLPDTMQELVARFQRNPIRISVKTGATAANVKQSAVRLQGREKTLVLHELLQQPEYEKVLVFVRTKHGTERLAKTLIQAGLAVATLHGNKSQSQRLRAIEGFKRHHINILLATDVAARGLHVDNVTHVINFDVPDTYENYVHRIGRTGRANKTGHAVTLVD